MKNLTDFRKTMETCLDPAPDLQDSVSQNFKSLSSVNRSHTYINCILQILMEIGAGF